VTVRRSGNEGKAERNCAGNSKRFMVGGGVVVVDRHLLDASNTANRENIFQKSWP
jgi:hypothetical protein